MPPNYRTDHEKLQERSASEDSLLFSPHISPQKSKPQMHSKFHDFKIGSKVQLNKKNGEKLYGFVRWIGIPRGHTSPHLHVELSGQIFDTDIYKIHGFFDKRQIYPSAKGHAILILPEYCKHDLRFEMNQGMKMMNIKTVPPLNIETREELYECMGANRGIQGYRNSCYLDVTLFSLFAFSYILDSVLYRPPNDQDVGMYLDFQNCLKNDVVYPLRTHKYVPSNRVYKLREMLQVIASVSGFTGATKDVEEFLNILLEHILRAEPFIKFNNGHDAYIYHIFVQKQDGLEYPTLQQIIDRSFFDADLKLTQVPPCFIVQMSRFHDFKVYKRIMPSQVLDLTDIIENYPRQCTGCGKLALYECRSCFSEFTGGLKNTAYCVKCFRIHQSHYQNSHDSRRLPEPNVNHDRIDRVPRILLDLFAIICIRTVHYSCFVRCGQSTNALWCFYDSMAEYKEQCCVPWISHVPEMRMLLSEDGFEEMNRIFVRDQDLTSYASKIYCDAYVYMYESKDVMMYK